MTDTYTLCIAIAVMAVVTYLPRVLPLAIFKRPIKNRFMQSFLIYMPYGVLAAMVFPDVFVSTASVISAIVGAAVALVMSYKRFALMPVALASTFAVLVSEYILGLYGII